MLHTLPNYTDLSSMSVADPEVWMNELSEVIEEDECLSLSKWFVGHG